MGRVGVLCHGLAQTAHLIKLALIISTIFSFQLHYVRDFQGCVFKWITSVPNVKIPTSITPSVKYNGRNRSIQFTNGKEIFLLIVTLELYERSSVRPSNV